MKRLLWVLLLVAAGARPAQAGMRARYGGELRVASPASPGSLDPAQVVTPTDVAIARLVHATLFSASADGTLSAELAASVPEAEAGGRLFRIKLKPGLRFHDGAALTAQDVAQSLARLLDPAAASPFAVLALPLVGATDAGRVSGLAATDLDLQASLAFAYPDWPRTLAHVAAAPLPGGKLGARPVGAGPFFFNAAPTTDLALLAFADCALGRPFVDSLRLTSADARAGGRALALGEVEAALGSTDKHAVEGPALFSTYLAFNPSRLGENAALVRAAVESSVDVADLARFFVRSASPMSGLLPPVLDLASGGPPGPPRALRSPRPTLPAGLQLTLVLDAGAEDQRAVAERLQIKLHDFGVGVQLKRLSRSEHRAALSQGGYDLALVGFAALPEPGMALAQLVHFAQGRDAARELLRALGAGPDAASRRALVLTQAALLKQRLPLLPLYVQAPRVAVRERVAPVGFDGCGAPALADAWLLEGKPRKEEDPRSAPSPGSLRP
jgi:peptide/nickel transport system substrate-binding protein